MPFRRVCDDCGCEADSGRLGDCGFEDQWFCSLCWQKWEEVDGSAVIEELGRRVIILRHGSRPDDQDDPPLDAKGERQAERVAAYIASQVDGEIGTAAAITAVYCSPFLRAMQTAAPVAQALGLPIRVEWGFCELLAQGWLHIEDPLPALRQQHLGPLPMAAQLDMDYESAVEPIFPDVVGIMIPGDAKQRQPVLDRHHRALDHALATAGGGSVLIVGHGATHDFVPGVLCPEEHAEEYHSGGGLLVPTCSITEIAEISGSWHLLQYGSTPWAAGRLGG